jgi:lauroyl/myristoyl acyltransferase
MAQSADRGRDLAEALARFAVELESAIRRHPHQWFCFRSLWQANVVESK